MGDTGSMFLGYVLATTSIMTNQKVSTAVAMLVEQSSEECCPRMYTPKGPVQLGIQGNPQGIADMEAFVKTPSSRAARSTLWYTFRYARPPGSKP